MQDAVGRARGAQADVSFRSLVSFFVLVWFYAFLAGVE